MQEGRQESSSDDAVSHSFIIQGAWGLERPKSSFLGVVAPPLYQVRY